MASPENIRLHISVNGGAPQTGAVKVEPGDVIALSLNNTSGVQRAVYRIWECPEDFGSPPAGWTAESIGYSVTTTNGAPAPMFTMPSHWGKYLLSVEVNERRRSGKIAQDLFDNSSLVYIESLSGVKDICNGETTQADPIRGYAGELKRTLRTIDGALGGVTGVNLPANPTDDGKLAYASGGNLAYGAVRYRTTEKGFLFPLSSWVLSGELENDDPARLIGWDSSGLYIGDGLDRTPKIQFNVASDTGNYAFYVGLSLRYSLSNTQFYADVSGRFTGSLQVDGNLTLGGGGTIGDGVNLVKQDLWESVEDDTSSAPLDVPIAGNKTEIYRIEADAVTGGGARAYVVGMCRVVRVGNGTPTVGNFQVQYSEGSGLEVEVDIDSNNLRVSVNNTMGDDCRLDTRIWRISQKTTVEYE